MMRLTIAGLAMATTLVFATATPLMEPLERQEDAVREVIRQAQKLSRFVYYQCGIKKGLRFSVDSPLVDSKTQAPKATTSHACGLLDLIQLPYSMNDTMTWFKQLTSNKEKMGLEDLIRANEENTTMNPQCKAWQLKDLLKIIELFDANGDSKLDFKEWWAMDLVLTTSEIIVAIDEEGCPELQV